ncbi:MAG: VOC family protein [Candidatus Nanopelagicales bacterium]
MLRESEAIAFIPVSDVDRAMHFYADVLGLRVIDCGDGYCALDAGGFTIRLTAVTDLPRAGHTVIGWGVTTIDEVAGDLASRGLSFQRYDGINQDDRGIWPAPNGDRVAWFCDPDFNLLSITEFRNDQADS